MISRFVQRHKSDSNPAYNCVCFKEQYVLHANMLTAIVGLGYCTSKAVINRINLIKLRKRNHY